MKKVYIYAASLVFALAAAQLQAQDRKQPLSGPVPTVHVGQPTSFVLKNGLKVLVVPNHKLPQVSYMLTIDNPLVVEGDKAGVTSILSEVLGNQTKKMSKEQFNDEIDFLGANVRFSAGGAFASGLSKYNETILGLLADGALNSVITQEEFDKAKAQVIESLKTSEKSVSAVAGRVEDALLYGKNTAAGEFETEATVSNVTLADVQEYYAKYFAPNNAYLVVVGDVDYKKTEKAVKSLFNNWKKSTTTFTEGTTNKNVAATQIDFVNMPNAVQSEIALVNEVNLKMTDSDYFAALLANQILGGGGEGRLFLNLREAHGWTYGAYSSISTARKYPGKFRASASVRNVVTDSAVTEFIKEINLMRTTLVKDEELKMAKAKYIGNFVMEIQKPETVARYALNKELHQLPADFYENYIKSINAVTPQDIQKAAQKYFLNDNMRIVIVGKGADVVPALEGLQKPMFFYDKEANAVEKTVFKKEVPAGVTVQTVLANYIQAIGGDAKVKAVKSLMITSEAEVQGMKLEMVNKVKDGFLSSEQKMMGAVMSKQVITPKVGYSVIQGQKAEITGEELKEAQAEATPFSELKANATAVLTGIESINGVDAYGVKVGNTTSYYDTATGLKVAVVQEVEQMGQKMQQVVNYSDYKEVKGIKFPFVQSMNVGIEIEMKIKEVKVNEGVSDADFK
ncbi:zinc protease [Myroides gitamensis]|uniref:M16 family metallopeptidase n=1 Tax=Myroides odoratus TaxID=256 RepID=UPI00216A5605|nr:pitrilysin family protein [Myroides odoratus]MCS4237481.1 putative Zn-dependent peptidase [Myroides odoratus]MDH6601781.1 zinc protease [Myroides gitamensis]